MKTLVGLLFGSDADFHTITALQMTGRAVLVFFAVLVLLRLSGKRTFGANTAFDMVVRIMLGAVMSRAVVVASPFSGTAVGRLVKGESLLLAENGRPYADNLRRSCITPEDLREGLRENTNLATLDHAQAVHLERDGTISVVKKEK